MSTNKFFRAGLIATVGVAAFALSANAQSRYGNIYDYESGHNCGQACTPPQQAPVTSSRYGAPVVAAPTYQQAPVYNPAPVYVDCVQAGTCAPQPSVVYTQPVQTYSQPSYTQPAYTQPSYTQSVQAAPPANCPSGTTPQSDGTCMQTGSSFSSGSTYSAPTTPSYSTPSYSEPSYSSSTSSSSFSSAPVNCPAGTTAQSDGTCMQGGSFSSTPSYSTPSYSEPSYSSSTSSSSFSSAPVNCPAGTTAQSDGTCMQGGSNPFAGSSVDLYQGDAASTPSSATTYGYGSDGSYGSNDYLPIRK